jgi:hypothetical protein
MRYLILSGAVLLILLIRPPFTMAQESVMPGGEAGIVQDPRIEQLMNKHIQASQAIKTMDGFRIQLFSDSGNNSKTRAQTVYDEFMARFPETGVYLTFKSPNYKVRIGDFRTKLDAQRFLNELSGDYPNAFIINDQINLPKVD